MTLFLLTFVIFALLFAGMAIGVILSNKPVKGTCGGISALGLTGDCEICGGDTTICETEQEQNQLADAPLVKTVDAMEKL